MESTNHLYEGLVKASVAAECAFHVAISGEYDRHTELIWNTLAAAKIIHCDVIRYLVTLEFSTKEGLVPLLWMGDVVSVLCEAKKWFLGTGKNNLLAIAKNTGYDEGELLEQMEGLESRFRLDDIEAFRYYRNKVGYHYDPHMIDHLRKFSEMDSAGFYEVIEAYKGYSNCWAILCKQVLDFNKCTPA
jgi:hypothetical protein